MFQLDLFLNDWELLKTIMSLNKCTEMKYFELGNKYFFKGFGASVAFICKWIA